MCSNHETPMKEIKGLSNEIATPPLEITRSSAMAHPQHTSVHLTHSSSTSIETDKDPKMNMRGNVIRKVHCWSHII